MCNVDSDPSWISDRRILGIAEFQPSLGLGDSPPTSSHLSDSISMYSSSAKELSLKGQKEIVGPYWDPIFTTLLSFHNSSFWFFCLRRFKFCLLSLCLQLLRLPSKRNLQGSFRLRTSTSCPTPDVGSIAHRGWDLVTLWRKSSHWCASLQKLEMSLTLPKKRPGPEILFFFLPPPPFFVFPGSCSSCASSRKTKCIDLRS